MKHETPIERTARGLQDLLDLRATLYTTGFTHAAGMLDPAIEALQNLEDYFDSIDR